MAEVEVLELEWGGAEPSQKFLGRVWTADNGEAVWDRALNRLMADLTRLRRDENGKVLPEGTDLRPSDGDEYVRALPWALHGVYVTAVLLPE